MYLSIPYNAAQWIVGRGVGLSSKTMWSFFIGLPKGSYEINRPWDPDDFGRCHRLLKMIPEWSARVKELAELSEDWKTLVDHWDSLTDMYDSNDRGMYQYMNRITNRS